MESKVVPLDPHVFAYWRLVVAGYEKLLERKPGYDGTGLPEYEYLSFFIFARHLVDQVKYDQPTEVQGNVDLFVELSALLSQCDEVCNTTKHFELVRKKNRGHRRPGYDESKFTIELGDDGDVADIQAHRTLTFHDGSEVDAMELATGNFLRRIEVVLVAPGIGAHKKLGHLCGHQCER